MSERPKSPSLPETNRRLEESCRTSSDRILLIVATATLGFFLWNTVQHGTGVADDHAFQAWSARFFFLLCIALAPSTILHARKAWREGLKRKELPRIQEFPFIKERSFRTEGPAQALIQHCTGQLDRFFRRFYAFHRYQAPYVAYFYYAKKGSFSVFGLPWMRTGFLLFFLICAVSLSRRDSPPLQAWELTVLGLGCLLVMSGLLVRLTVSHQEVWLRIVEENNRVCLTLSHLGGRRRNVFEGLYRAFTRNEAHSGPAKE